MVTLPFVCPVASEIKAALDEQRIPDAKRIAAEHLRTGYHSRDFLNVVAKILEVKKQHGKIGRKPRKSEPYWLEIGSEIEGLRDEGMTIEEAVEELKTKYGSRNTIQKAWAYFRKANKEHDELS
jgi:hypothetical protein